MFFKKIKMLIISLIAFISGMIVATQWTGDIDPDFEMGHITMDKDKTITAHYTTLEKICGDLCHSIQEGDVNGDCYINMTDFMSFSKEWLSCTHPDCD